MYGTMMRGYDVITEQLIAEGIETIFTFMASDTMHLMAGIEEDNKPINLVKTRHEQGAVSMADGYARSGRQFGVALVGRGPGVAQTGTGMITAKRKGSNVIVIAPETSTTAEFDNKEFEQEAYLRSTIGEVISIRSHETLLPKLEDALHRIHNENGPLALQISENVLNEPYEFQEDNLPKTGQRRDVDTQIQGRVEPDEELVEQAIDLYVDSDAYRPPLILVGQGAISSDAKNAIYELAERTSALLTSSLQARHYVADHPFYLGFTGSWGSNLANKYASESHLVFAIGASLNPYTTDKDRVFGDETQLIHIDADPSTIGRHTDVTLGIHGDGLLTVESLVAELDRMGIDRDGELWTDELRNEIETFSPMNDMEFESVPDTVDPRPLVRRLDQILPEPRKVVTDGGHFNRWVLDTIQTGPTDYIFTSDFSSIGQGLPIGIGTAHGSKEHTCVTFCGDAGFMMSLQELDTAVRESLPIIIVVGNDGSLGSEYHALDSLGKDPDVALIQGPQIASMAESMGAESHVVRCLDDLEEIAPTLGEKPDKPFVLECKINHKIRHRTKM